MAQDQIHHNLKKSTLISAFSLFFQSGYSAILGLIANLIISVLLTPELYGVYVLVLSMIAFLNYFSDIGLAASLIQKKVLLDEDVYTTFTIQQLLIVTLVALGFVFTPLVKNIYKTLPVDAIYLYHALLISFFISSLKTIPSIFLERKIQYQKIVFVQIIENTVFYISISIFAILGFKLQSFTISVIIRAVVGLILMYRISFWMPKIGISFKSLKNLLAFGLPFQSSSFLALFKDDLIMLFLGNIVGLKTLGEIGWAKKWAEAPIRIIMDNVTRIIFPLIARHQDDKVKVGQLSEKVLFYQTGLLAPIMVGSGFIMMYVINIIPRYSQWAQALPVFYIFCLSSFLVIYIGPFINIFNALGRVKLSFGFMIFWTIIMWLGTVYLTKMFGIYGFPLTHLIISLTFFLVIYQAQKIIKFSFFRPIYKFIISALVMGLSLSAVAFFIKVNPILHLIITLITGVLVYGGMLTIIFKMNLINEIKKLFEIKS